jgi:hypothetical protein
MIGTYIDKTVKMQNPSFSYRVLSKRWECLSKKFVWRFLLTGKLRTFINAKAKLFRFFEFPS